MIKFNFWYTCTSYIQKWMKHIGNIAFMKSKGNMPWPYLQRCLEGSTVLQRKAREIVRGVLYLCIKPWLFPCLHGRVGRGDLSNERARRLTRLRFPPPFPRPRRWLVPLPHCHPDPTAPRPTRQRRQRGGRAQQEKKRQCPSLPAPAGGRECGARLGLAVRRDHSDPDSARAPSQCLDASHRGWHSDGRCRTPGAGSLTLGPLLY
jgi:hypothetical protein